MRFWDSSALVPLFVAQKSTTRARALQADDPECVVWVLSDVEVRSALARLQRADALTAEDVLVASDELERAWDSFHVVSLVDPVKQRAKRLLGLHELRAANALQLAAALTATADQPSGVEFVSYDERLNAAARREGFRIAG
jgi:predicted nucleic acid-binding protein